MCALLLAAAGLMPSNTMAASPAPVANSGEKILRWGADREGGGPYVFPDSAAPGRVSGFEVELARELARSLVRTPQMVQCSWDQILPVLERGDIDVALNGYEYTPQRARRYASSLPYYIYELGLCVRGDDASTSSWSQLAAPARPGSRRKRIGVLGGSAADHYVIAAYGKTCDVARYDGTTETFLLVQSGQLDASVQDMPSLHFYLEHLKRYPRLKIADRPIEPGYYVAYARPADTPLVQQINAAIRQLYTDGRLRRIYEKYGIWNEAQLRLAAVWDSWPPPDESKETAIFDEIRGQVPLFFRAAGVTVLLAVLSMPLAIGIGLAIALIRGWPLPVLGGDGNSGIAGRGLRGLSTFYVEVIRGTPLAFQLFVVYFVLPEFGLTISAFWAGVLALAVNYSAYEAEIMRLGFQSIPRGQMEAALCLGMHRALAVRRIILPQAIRTVIPATANDFIALFKDTAVCSVIAVEELSKQYSIAAKSSGLYLQMAILASLLYLAMSYPLSLLAAWLERRLRHDG